MSMLEAVRNGLNFENRALRSLPVDCGEACVRTVPNACFARVQPTPVRCPRMVVASRDAFELVDLPKELAERSVEYEEAHDELIQYLAGNKIWPGSEPAAHCYCGYQFGNFAGQLGDGAVIYLGEVVNSKGERWELQLKGAGLTPFSRQADGRKVLRSSLREFLCSEAMHHLGIPTTRAASVVTSDTWVQRDVFYTGNIISERASITSRLAPSFIRFGSFEISQPINTLTDRQGPSAGNPEIVPQLVNYVIETFYPKIWSERAPNDLASLYLTFFTEVVRRTASLVALWQTVGFCHGVLNTDNMSILGLTMDYGPFGFMDRFMWDHVCNASDTDGRYSYAQQPTICAWNCARLAECLIHALGEGSDSATATDSPSGGLSGRFRGVIDTHFVQTFQTVYLQQMRRKLGLLASVSSEDEELIRQLFNTMEQTGADFTNTFLALSACLSEAVECHEGLDSIRLSPDRFLNECCDVDELREAYEPSDVERDRELLLRFSGIIRHLVERMEDTKILKTEEKQRRLQLLQDMTNEDKRMHDRQLWQNWLDRYLARLRTDMEQRPDATVHHRIELMNQTNPRVVLRNYMAEKAIKAAESDNYVPAKMLLEALSHPYTNPVLTNQPQTEFANILVSCARPPEWARDLRVS